MIEMKDIVKTVLPYVIILAVVIILKVFIVTPVKVNGTSMYPTLSSGDILILNKTSYWFSDIKRFDIVVINNETVGREMIKRVIGLPGDKIEYRNSKLYVNDEEVPEEFTHKETADFNLSELEVTTVPEGNYFVVGDNRTDSYDSRYFGFIAENEIEGKANFLIFPFTRLGTVK